METEWGWAYWNTRLQCWTYIGADEEEYIYLHDVDDWRLPPDVRRSQGTTPRWDRFIISRFMYGHRQFQSWAYMENANHSDAGIFRNVAFELKLLARRCSRGARHPPTAGQRKSWPLQGVIP